MAEGGLEPGQQTPLECMLEVSNDPTADPARRDALAIAAARYCHPRMYDNRVGKKDGQAAAAMTAGAGTAWAGDLEFEGRAN
jgi:hypothetical protein